jgi:hypothetical protein
VGEAYLIECWHDSASLDCLGTMKAKHSALSVECHVHCGRLLKMTLKTGLPGTFTAAESKGSVRTLLASYRLFPRPGNCH